MTNIRNCKPIDISEIEELDYSELHNSAVELLARADAHCVNYFAVPQGDGYMLLCIIATDNDGLLHILRSHINASETIEAITASCTAIHSFEREMHEKYSIKFQHHPWLKPLRYPYDRATTDSMYDYPFFNISSEEFHRVAVGPIHAGIIEPGHFRFICDGERIKHLEIQLGWQHRGVEHMMIEKQKPLQRATIAENIAGDTVVGHSVAYANAWEALCGFTPNDKLKYDRTIALEHERIAVHTGDLGGICTDIAYQLGNAVLGRLRTPMINYFQEWTGSRFAKALIRPGYSHYPFTTQLAERWQQVIAKYKPDFIEMVDKMFDQPSVLSRIERTGVVSTETAQSIGMVGIAARASGMERDIRKSHKYLAYDKLNISPITKESGDVYARARVRYEEVLSSIENIENLIQTMPQGSTETQPERWTAKPNQLVVSLVEGWRGEICHCAITNAEGKLEHYKIKDPSMHNWLGLALAVRDNGISDFPICNKSFDLSYSGHDL